MRRRAADDLGTSLEDAGRTARYELFARVATELGADVVATGHTVTIRRRRFCCVCSAAPARADSAEFIRALAGSSRPLLDLDRAELRAYLSQLGQPFREDESNAT